VHILPFSPASTLTHAHPACAHATLTNVPAVGIFQYIP